eukprot:250849-Chlamydomonas_euryale.AAC.5
MELYASNNRLGELREVQRLRDLSKLVILDLSGNPLTGGGGTGGGGVGGGGAAAGSVAALLAEDDYRQYTIYSVRKLKVRRSWAAPQGGAGSCWPRKEGGGVRAVFGRARKGEGCGQLSAALGRGRGAGGRLPP